MIAECFMRSKTDFPKLGAETSRQFNELFGKLPGKFAALLRESAQQSCLSEIKTGIEGLTVIYRKGWE